MGLGVGVCVEGGAGLVAGISTRTFSSGPSSSSSKLVKLESEDKLLSDAELWLEEFESDLGRPPSRCCPSSVSPPTAKRRRATSNHLLIPIFLAFQSAITQVGQRRVRFEDPAGILWVQEGVVQGRGAVVVVAVAVAEPEMADDDDDDDDDGLEVGGIGRGVRLAARGTVACSSEATGMAFFPWVLDLGPGLIRFLPMIGAA